ncbi:hypothetical protein T479_00880 [Lysinibacillus varians]|nr:hypothetical protein T479_00880 [Lysinibacillus varians]
MKQRGLPAEQDEIPAKQRGLSAKQGDIRGAG